MGVYINMSMPENCVECRLGNRYGLVGDQYCHLLKGYYTNNPKPPYKERPDECPLVEILPHSKLIDLNQFECISFKDTEGWEDTFDAGVQWMLEKLDATPAIIEAEK